VDLRIGGNRNFEIGDVLQPSHQIGGIGVAARTWDVAAAAGHIATQRHNVAHADLPVGTGDGVNLVARGIHAGQVRGRCQRGFAHDARYSGVGAGLGGASGAVGDRDETRRQRLKPVDTVPKLLVEHFGTRREELERELWRLVAAIASRQGGEAGTSQPTL